MREHTTGGHTEDTGSVWPSWDAYWTTVDSEEYLTAKALLELSPTVRADVANWLRWQHEDVRDDDANVLFSERWPDLDWDGWAADVDRRGRPFSSTERQLVDVVAALTAGRLLRLDVLTGMGSWEIAVWRILTQWGTGGNNRDRVGRAIVTTRPRRRPRPGGDR